MVSLPRMMITNTIAQVAGNGLEYITSVSKERLVFIGIRRCLCNEIVRKNVTERGYLPRCCWDVMRYCLMRRLINNYFNVHGFLSNSKGDSSLQRSGRNVISNEVVRV